MVASSNNERFYDMKNNRGLKATAIIMFHSKLNFKASGDGRNKKQETRNYFVLVI